MSVRGLPENFSFKKFLRVIGLQSSKLQNVILASCTVIADPASGVLSSYVDLIGSGGRSSESTINAIGLLDALQDPVLI